MPDLRRALAPTCPVLAGMIGAIGVRPAVRLRAGENIMLVRSVAETLPGIALLGQRRCSGQRVADASQLEGIAMQVREVLRDPASLGVEPGALADAVARVDGARSAGAQIGMPGPAARPGRRRQLLAMLVG